MDIEDKLELAILAYGLSEYVSLMAAEGSARRITGLEPAESFELTLDVLGRLQEKGLVRVGRLSSDQRVIVENLDDLYRETRARFRSSATSGRDEWSWYLASENTTEGNAYVRAAPEEVLRELFPGWPGWPGKR